MASLLERMGELRAMRRQQPEPQMLPLGIPKWMLVALVAFAVMFLLQAWMKHVGRGAGAEGGGVVPRAGIGLSTAAPSRSTTATQGAVYKAYFAPGDDLGGIDGKLLASAGKMVDLAAAGELDDTTCRAIGAAARRGVAIRVLRDVGGYAAEQDRAGGSCSEGLAGIGVAVRVDSGPMVLHSYEIDGKLLRSGTAGLGPRVSQAGEELSVSASPAAVADFERSFGQLWNQTNNRVVRGGSEPLTE